MDIYEFAVALDKKIDTAIGILSDVLWGTFLFVQKSVFEPLYYIGGEVWFFASLSITAVYLSLFKWAAILPSEKSWQLFLIRTCLSKGLIILTPLALLAWLFGAYHFSTTKLNESFYDDLLTYIELISSQLKQGFVYGLIPGFLLIFVTGRFLEPVIDRWLNRRTKKLSKHALSDVRYVAKELPKPVSFNPYRFFSKAKKLNALFFGKDAKNKPIFIPRSEWNNSNILLIGPTRRGKGVQAAMVLAQCLFVDEPDVIVVIDPKKDDWGPLVLRDACHRRGLPFIYVDARRGQAFQFNLLRGATKEELIALLESGYDLQPKGSGDDHYRNLEAEAVESIVELCEPNATLADLYHIALELFSDAEQENIQSLISKLKRDSKISSVNAKRGPSVEDLLSTGGVFWFVGSEDDISVVRIQRMFAQRAVQVFRNRPDKSRHGTILADELKQVLSGNFYRNFGTLLGRGNANIVAAVQSINDLQDIPQNLNPEAVTAAILDNSTLKWVYRNNHPATVDWVVQSEGSRVISKRRFQAERNAQLAERSLSDHSISKEETPFLHRNHVIHLPNNCAILLGFGLAQIAYTSPIKVPFEDIQPTHTEAPSPQPKLSPGDDLL